jgi:hypothetical protein
MNEYIQIAGPLHNLFDVMNGRLQSVYQKADRLSHQYMEWTQIQVYDHLVNLHVALGREHGNDPVTSTSTHIIIRRDISMG